MTVKTFPRGIFLPHYKEFSEHEAITSISLPKEIIIPLQQHIGAPCQALVKVGDRVTAGQKIGQSEAFVCAPIHASLDGTVIAVEPRPNFNGKNVESVVIAVDPDQIEPTWPERDTDKLSTAEIRSAIKEAGIVGMGGATFPTHVKLSPPKPIDTIIINACECEPFLTCDHRMMLEMTEALVEGARLIARVVDAPHIVFGVEINKPDALEAIKSNLGRDEHITIVPLAVKYPQGSEKQLIKASIDREVPPGKLPLEVGVVVQNVATAIAVYEACRYQKPSYERVLTVSGDAIVRPSNLKVKIGTPIGFIIKECGGIKGAPTGVESDEEWFSVPLPKADPAGKIILGGPMTGWSQSRLDIPVTKGTSGILVFSPQMITETDYKDCVRCGKCVEHCPMFLYPNFIGLYTEQGRYDLAAEWGAIDCFECGICVYVCPSNRPIVHFVRETKEQIAAAARAAQNK
ncbi:MAG: RnfABCDGE type electron transport complex subunit C [Firmicutes bacterium]|nr:RnfABCDGE type electron transport complex subunit C [Bacillota bacterium]